MTSDRIPARGPRVPAAARTVLALLAAADSALLAGHVQRAADLLVEASAVTADEADRTEVLCRQARLALLTGDRAAPLAELRAAADAIGASRPDLAARLRIEAVPLMLCDRDPEALAVASVAHPHLHDADPATRAQADAALGLAHALHGDRTAAQRYLPGDAQLSRPGGGPQQATHVVGHLVIGLAALERYRPAWALCRRHLAAIRSVGAEGLLPTMLCLLAGVANLTGEFDTMELAANEALVLARVQGQDAVAAWAENCLVRVCAVRGTAPGGPAGASDSIPAPTGPAPTAIRAFGPLTLVRGGRETPVGLDGPGRALRYLVTCGGSVRADQLIDVLWPDAGTEAGRARLRTVLFRVRSRYGPVLVRDGTVVRWADGVSVDVQRFDRLARAALGGGRDEGSARLAREAIALYGADLLPLARYADWAVAARERLRQRYLDLLTLLADDAAERDNLPAAIGYAREIIDADPLDESGYVRLARLHLDAGRPGPARDTLAAAKHAAAELGLPVSADLVRVERRVADLAATGA